MPVLPVQPEEKKAENTQEVVKNPFEVLTSELAGKTRDELTPEQREVEDTYREKCFRDLMQLINDDKVLIHRSLSLRSVLENGILSRVRRMVKRKGTYSHPADRWQDSAEAFSDQKVWEFIVAYSNYKDGKVSNEEFIRQRESIIDKYPELGKERARYYFENVLPNGFDRGFFDASRPDGAIGFLNEFFPSGTIVTLSYAKRALKAFRKVDLLGNDTISTTNTNILKKEWVVSMLSTEKSPLFIGSGWYSGHSFIFDRPQEHQLMALDPNARKEGSYDKKYDKEENIHDTGVASRVTADKILSVALDNCLYDGLQRTLFLMQNYTATEDRKGYQEAWEGQYVDDETLELLKKKQRLGIALFDETMQAIPVIESISVERVSCSNCEVKGWSKSGSLTEKDRDDLEHLKVLINENFRETKEKINQLIQENHWDWYEKYGEKEEGNDRDV